MIKCPNPDCGYENVDGTQFCEGCGEELPQNAGAAGAAPASTQAAGGAAPAAGASAVKCPACDNLNDPANEFCEVCGTALKPGASAPTTTPAADAAPVSPSLPPATPMIGATTETSIPASTTPSATASIPPMTSPSITADPTLTAPPSITPPDATTPAASITTPDPGIAAPQVSVTPLDPTQNDPTATTPTSIVTPPPTDPVVSTQTAPDVAAPIAGGELAPGKVKLTVEQGMTIGKQFVLGDNEMQVGREDEEENIFPDIDLSDQDEGYVHRKHATLKFENGGLTLTHLGGANKTRINNRPLPDNEAQPVNMGDKIAFGKVVLRVGAL